MILKQTSDPIVMLLGSVKSIVIALVVHLVFQAVLLPTETLSSINRTVVFRCIPGQSNIFWRQHGYVDFYIC